MPPAPRKPCAKPGCGKLSDSTYCGEHTVQKQTVQKRERIRYDNERGTSASRGYGSRWTKYSKQYRENNPLCVHCQKEGRLTLAQCVDHIKAVSGPDDPLFYDVSNLQSLCQTCHSRKTILEDQGFGYQRKERFV